MNKMILSALLVLSASTSFARMNTYTCGELAVSDVCDVDFCRVSIQAGEPDAPNYITIAKLNGVSMRRDVGLLQLGLDKAIGKMICVTGEVLGDQFIPEAQVADEYNYLIIE